MQPPNDYLDTATAGFAGDAEFRLELRQTLARELAALPDVGHWPPAAAMAARLQAEHGARLRYRARRRRLLFWLLIPTGLLLTVWLQGPWFAFAHSGGLDEAPRHAATPDATLILYGDRTRPTPALQQRALCARWPDSPLFLHNYLSVMMGEYPLIAATPAARYAVVAPAFAAARRLEPDNARVDYLEAALLLEQGFAFQRGVAYWWPHRDGTGFLTVRDPQAAAKAMALLLQGLAKPHFRRHSRELQELRLAIRGVPTSFNELLDHQEAQQQLVCPEWDYLPVLAEASVAWGCRLLTEGRHAEARAFLAAWPTLVLQLNRDSYLLTDTFTVYRICQALCPVLPAAWARLGETESGAGAARQLRAFMAPTEALRGRNEGVREAFRQLPPGHLPRYYNYLLAEPLDRFGEPVPAELVAPLRFLDYVVSARMVLAFVCFAVAAAALPLLLFGGLAWRLNWRRSVPPLPIWLRTRDTLRIVTWAGALPVLLFLLSGWFLPGSGWESALSFNSDRFLLQGMALLFAVFLLTLRLTRHRVHQRCVALKVDVPQNERHYFWWFMAGATGLLFTAGFLAPAAWFGTEAWWIPPAIGTFLAATAMFAALMRRWDRLYGRPGSGDTQLFERSWPLSLVQVFTVLLLFLNLVVHPLLRLEERRLLTLDTIRQVDPNWGGLGAIEQRTVRRLKAEVAAAARRAPQHKGE